MKPGALSVFHRREETHHAGASVHECRSEQPWRLCTVLPSGHVGLLYSTTCNSGAKCSGNMSLSLVSVHYSTGLYRLTDCS